MTYDSTAPYPRDLVGYGRHPPHARWPGNARVALQFVLNHEEGGENSVLHGDAGSEQFLSEMFNPVSYPARHLSMEGIYEYGSRVGVWRILREFEQRGLPLTVFGVGMALQRHPELTAAFAELGHEIACHGWRWIHYQDVDEATEREHLRIGVQIIEQMTGQRPLGWYTGRDSPNTRRLVVDHGGFEYDSDYYGDDLPFWMKVRRTDGQVVPHLVVPYTLDCNDMRFSLPQGFSHADPFFQYLRDSFDALYAQGDEAPRMMSVGMHSRLLGRPGRIVALQRFLDHVARHDRVWVCRRIDIARHWKQVHPYNDLKNDMALTLDQLNAASPQEAARMLDGLYEHSPWIVEAALEQRPFASLAALKHAAARAVAQANRERQLALIRAHPELAGKAMVSQRLTAESTLEQNQAGLTHCTPQEFDRLQRLNAAYNARFGFPFVLAVRGPRGTGLDRAQIIEAFERRLENPPDIERAECLRNIHRIAEIRLNDKFEVEPTLGNRVWDWLEQLAAFSDPGWREQGQLTVTYLTEAHRQAAAFIEREMRACGFDEVGHDAVGNVVGIYHGHDASAPRLLTGSHYDTVRNGGRFDGRLGIFVPIACVRELSMQGRRLRHGVEVVAFAEEEGQRYPATFLGSGALVGQFDPAWLDQTDSQGISMREAMRSAGLPGTLEAIDALRRDPSRYLSFVEVHIEQGPVLNELDLPLGVVTSINGGVRLLCEMRGMASHAGTTPMDRRHDAAAAVAELLLYVERRAASDGDSVGTVGLLQVPGGSVNVVPARCQFSLDLRAPIDARRDAMLADVLAELDTICARRGTRASYELTMRASAAPSAPDWRQRWEAAVQAIGAPLHHLPSGAGHDAMKLHEAMPQAMLFVRGQNAGISHNPLESTTSDDIDLAVRAFAHLYQSL